jgi:citrate lyase subunit beta-like protein
MRARRALLYVPGDDFHKIQKAANLDVDSVCLDLEDGVASNRKAEARKTISHALRSLDFGKSERLVRVNPASSGMLDADLEETIVSGVDGVVLPKVSHTEQIQELSKKISAIELDRGWKPASIILIAIIESAQAVINLDSIASADARLEALIFGAEDFAANIGATRTAAGWEVFYARSAVVTHCAAHQLQAIDMVNINFHDDLALRTASEQGSGMGFAGKQIIHPNQVKIVQDTFTPNPEEIENAVNLIEKFVQYQNQGQGAFALDGIMVDAPLIKAAESVIERAKAAGKIYPEQLTRLGG